MQLRFSLEPGFYDYDIELKLLGGRGLDVYYTLDGSTPSREATPYQGAIVLENASKKDNVYSLREDISAGFLTDYITEYCDGGYGIPGYTVPEENVDKVNIVRAAIINDTGNIISEVVGSFFVGLDEEKYQNLRIVSVISDPYNFFDYSNGIYVLGQEFDDKFQKDVGDNPYWMHWRANYHLDQTRECFVEMYDKSDKGNRNILIKENCLMKIRGGGSRGYSQKSMAFISDKNTGVGEFPLPLFENDRLTNKFILFSGADDNKYKILDSMVNKLSAGLDFAISEYVPAAVFLDGEYWGMYYIAEDFDKDYFEDYYNVSADGVVMLKGMEEKEGVGGASTYQNVIEKSKQMDLSIVDNYLEMTELIDVQSLIDYYAVEAYIGRSGDWPNGNEGHWKAEKGNSDYADGKWRWALYDINSGACADPQKESIEYILGRSELFSAFYENEEFKEAFLDRLKYVSNEIFSDEKVDEFIDEYLCTLYGPINDSYFRFYGKDAMELIKENAETVRSFFYDRHIYIEKIIAKQYN